MHPSLRNFHLNLYEAEPLKCLLNSHLKSLQKFLEEFFLYLAEVVMWLRKGKAS